MKKKHRDIVVDDVKYGWIANGWNEVKIFKTKNDFVEYIIPEAHHEITPKIVAALIKNPVLTMMWLKAEPCPFCGKLVERSEANVFVCVHEEDCWVHITGTPYSVIPQVQLSAWNKRHS